MMLATVLVAAALWSSALSKSFKFQITNSTRISMRLSATFSVSDPETTSAVDPVVNTPNRIALDIDSPIRFQNTDNFVSAAPKPPDKMISQGVSQLTLDIDRAIAPAGKVLDYNENTIFSPVSISMALALVMLGARGQTMREISKVLGQATRDDVKSRSDLTHQQFGALLAMFDQNSREDAPTRTSIANGIFLQQGYPIKERFQRLGRDLYKSDVISVDFNRQSRQAGIEINKWVESKTAGRIKGFLSGPPATQTRVLLASAIYFNGEWENPFPIESTRKRPFYVSGSKQDSSDSEVLQVDMMANGVELPNFNDAELGCQIVGLPYKGKKISMYVVLPNARGFEGLNALKEKLTVPVLDNLVASASPTSVILLMPRMKLEATLNLRGTLETLGVRSLFDPRYSDLGEISSGDPRSAAAPVVRRPNLPHDNDRFTFSSRFGDQNETESGNGDEETTATSIPPTRSSQVKGGWTRNRRAGRQNASPNPGLYVDDVIHKVEIEVTETGTVASAATAVSISRDGGHRVVRLDRPFLFFIRHEESKLMLFWGSVVRPT